MRKRESGKRRKKLRLDLERELAGAFPVRDITATRGCLSCTRSAVLSLEEGVECECDGNGRVPAPPTALPEKGIHPRRRHGWYFDVMGSK